MTNVSSISWTTEIMENFISPRSYRQMSHVVCGVVGSTPYERWGVVDFSPAKPILVNLGGGNTQRHTRVVFGCYYLACQG